MLTGNLLTRMVGIGFGHHLKGIGVQRLGACLTVIGLIGSFLDAGICGGTIRKCLHHTCSGQQHTEQHLEEIHISPNRKGIASETAAYDLNERE